MDKIKLSIRIYHAGAKTGHWQQKRVIVDNTAPVKQLKREAMKAHYKADLDEWINAPFKRLTPKTQCLRQHLSNLKAIKADKRIGKNVRFFKTKYAIADLLGVRFTTVDSIIRGLREAGAIETKPICNRFYKGFYIKF